MVCGPEDVVVPAEEGEHEDPDHDHPEAVEEKDRFGEGEGEGAGDDCAEAGEVRCAGERVRGSIAGVAGEALELFGLPVEQYWSVGFSLGEDYKNEDYSCSTNVRPFCAPPGGVGFSANVAAYDRTEDGAHQGCIGEDGESVGSLLRRPEIADAGAAKGQGSRAEEASEETEG